MRESITDTTIPSAGICVYLPASILRQLEASRGDVPRSLWVRRAIEERLSRAGAAAEPRCGR